jgi:hypothetical protein
MYLILATLLILCALRVFTLPLSISNKIIKFAVCLVIFAVIFAANGFALYMGENYRIDVKDGVLAYKFTEYYEGRLPLEQIDKITVTRVSTEGGEKTRLTVRALGADVFSRDVPNTVYKYLIKPKTKALSEALGDKFTDQT